MSTKLEHVSDTALLVAAARAMESERADALVRDPFAARLAGEKGMALTRNIGHFHWMTFGIGLRSKFIDEMIMPRVESNAIGCVLNLGAGLDTRPWRLELPSNFRWIEVDFPEMLEYKAEALRGETPKCRLERASADLNNAEERERVLNLAGGSEEATLLLTEGLLMYLPAESVRALGRDTYGRMNFKTWILDISSPQLMSMVHGDGARDLGNLRADTHLESGGILQAVEETGWVKTEGKTYMKDGQPYGAERVRRDGIQIDPSRPRPPEDDPAGVWLFQRSA
ncbi:MAG: class I SAM-dependent methyltransferase [Acidobacteriaceae bacterium]|nr:class I SAM-dependent methyltransferase [Acidobacteriaceae bacterium]